MQYESPAGGVDTGSYSDPNPALGTEGSLVRAPAIENHQRELDHLIAFAGLVPSRGDLQQVRKAIQAIIGAAIPPGTLRVSAAATPAANELLCNGQAVSRVTYANLFAAIGTTWGAGDLSTTFNVPDLRGRALLAAGAGTGLTARTLGQLLGAETHTLTLEQMPNHHHTYELHSDDGPNIKGDTVIRNADERDTSGVVGHSLPEGQSLPHNNMQPSAVVNVYIHV